MTITVRTPKLAYLSQPEPGRVFLNLQFEEVGISRGQGPFEQVELNADQLRNIVIDGVAIALSAKAVT